MEGKKNDGERSGTQRIVVFADRITSTWVQRKRESLEAKGDNSKGNLTKSRGGREKKKKKSQSGETAPIKREPKGKGQSTPVSTQGNKKSAGKSG